MNIMYLGFFQHSSHGNVEATCVFPRKRTLSMTGSEVCVCVCVCVSVCVHVCVYVCVCVCVSMGASVHMEKKL